MYQIKQRRKPEREYVMKKETVLSAIDNYNFDFFDNLADCIREYMEYNNEYDSLPMSWEEVEEYISTLSPIDAFRAGQFTDRNFYMSDDYFCFNGYGNLKSYSSLLLYFREEVDVDGFVEWYNENN